MKTIITGHGFTIEVTKNAKQDSPPFFRMTDELIEKLEFLFQAVERGEIPGLEAAESFYRPFV